MDAHLLAERYPLLTGSQYKVFKADIIANGLLNPITLFGGKVLDGRNRMRVCEETGIKPKLIEFTGTEEEASLYVEAENLHRRHLDAVTRKRMVDERAE